LLEPGYCFFLAHHYYLNYLVEFFDKMNEKTIHHHYHPHTT